MLSTLLPVHSGAPRHNKNLGSKSFLLYWAALGVTECVTYVPLERPQVVLTAVVIVIVAGQLHLFAIRDVLGKRTEAVPIPCKRGRWLRYPPLVPGLMGRFPPLPQCNQRKPPSKGSVTGQESR